MLVNCPQNCKMARSTTEASLNLDTNMVECLDCGLEIEVSKFAKISMKNQKDIIKKKRRAFVFECKKCEKNVQAVNKNGMVVGRECPNSQNECLINITKAMKVAIGESGDYEEGDGSSEQTGEDL